MPSQFLSRNDWDWKAFRIGSQFASLLINGDASGIEDSEARALDAFCTEAQEGCEGGHWTVDDGMETFARCEITRLMGECVNVRYMFKVSP